MKVLVACEYSGKSREAQGIANAMAQQWGDFLLSGKKIHQVKQLTIF